MVLIVNSLNTVLLEFGKVTLHQIVSSIRQPLYSYSLSHSLVIPPSVLAHAEDAGVAALAAVRVQGAELGGPLVRRFIILTCGAKKHHKCFSYLKPTERSIVYK